MSTEIRISEAGSATGVDRWAPVIGGAEASVDAPIDTVWRILSDIEHWPDWNKSISKMRLAGPVRVGTVFHWSSGVAKIASRLEEIDPPWRIAWSGRTMGIQAIHVYTLDEEIGGTRVITEESFAGPLAWILRRTLKKKLDRDLEDGLVALRAEAERQARAEEPAADPCLEEHIPSRTDPLTGFAGDNSENRIASPN